MLRSSSLRGRLRSCVMWGRAKSPRRFQLRLRVFTLGGGFEERRATDCRVRLLQERSSLVRDLRKGRVGRTSLV